MENVFEQAEAPETSALTSKGARCPELQNVKRVIDLYIDGVRNGKPSSLQQAFHPQASAFGWTGNNLYMIPIQGLFDHAATSPSPASTGEPTNFFINSIQITGNAATVELAMDHYQGANYLDFFQLLKVEGRWWIVSKLWHAEPST